MSGKMRRGRCYEDKGYDVELCRIEGMVDQVSDVVWRYGWDSGVNACSPWYSRIGWSWGRAYPLNS